MNEILTVELGENAYPIYIGPGFLADDTLLSGHIHGDQVLIVTNETIEPLYLSALTSMIEKRVKVETVVLPDGEKFKTLESINKIFDQLLTNQCNRRVTLLALGGGVIGDMTGFAAACYQRGVNFIQIPTTLLSQVDSSVGGKTGVNHPLGKNMIGAFYQPKCVIIDTNVLTTLPDKELSAGIAEIIKYGAIADEAFFCWLEQNMSKLLARDEESLIYAIKRSCEMKAKIVAEDEKESGIRAILNFGHTFGHAIEAHMGYGKWLHGEAVAAGMCLASQLSVNLGWIEQPQANRVEALCRLANLPIEKPNNMSFEDFLGYMKVDKKNISNKIRLVLLKELGEACITEEVSEEQLKRVIEA